MTIKYKKINDPLTGNHNAVNKIQDGIAEIIYIPFDPANTDYQAYLKWVSEGNTPEQAD
jgi:hypothetical protein